MLTIRQANASNQPAWDGYVLHHQEGLAYHLFAWKQSIESAYGFDCPSFLAERSGRICGVLPTARIRWPFRPGSLVSLPYCDIGGILANDPETAQALVTHALEYASQRGILELELRSSSSPYNVQPTTYNLQPNKTRPLLSLPESSEALLASFKSKLRSQVKKPLRDGLQARLGGVELLDAFYPVFAENMRDLGSPVHSKAWIESILTHYGPRAKCGLVLMPDGTPAACGIILCTDRTVSIPWASSLKKFNRANPNMLLYWSFLEHAADHGFDWFDFGRSTPGEGTYKFKLQWGAEPYPLHWIRLDTQTGGQAGSSGESVSNSRARAAAEKAIQSLPVPVATFLGSRMRKYIAL
jgi:FemAB-related protein (PEP-CTERM system-associated)